MAFNEDTSFIEYPVDQPTQDFVTNFDTIGGTTDVVLVTVDGVLTDTPESSFTVQQINHTTWRVTPEVQTGSVVRLYRVTNIDEMMHVFTAGAKFIARNMDSNFKQIRHAQQEVRDAFDFLEYNTLGVVEAARDATERANEAAETAEDLVLGIVSDSVVTTWSGRTQEEKNKDVVDIADFGGVPDNLTENKDAWDLLTGNKQNYIATLAKGNYKITPPTVIDPNLRYSYYPPYGIAGLLHLQHGTESNPERTVGQITQVVRRVNNSSRNFNYEEQIGSALFDTKIKGTGDVNNPNLCGWVSGIFNIYKEAKCESGKLDQKGSVVGLTTFAGCDYLDDDRLVAGLWARAVSPKPSDVEYDQITGTWHTVGAEINARIRHKDTGYRENMGKGTSAVLMFYNNIRPEDIASGSTVHARNNTFGLLFGGGKFAELANTIDNYNGYYTGIQLNYIKSVGIDFPNRAGSGAVGIRFAQTRTSNGSYKTAIDLGNNKLRFGDGSFGYGEADNGDIWYNGGTLYMKDARYNTVSSRFMLADSYTSVGTNPIIPTHFITVRWNSTTNFKIPAIMESV